MKVQQLARSSETPSTFSCLHPLLVLVNLNNVRREATIHFRNKQKEHLKAKIEELDTNSNIKKYLGLV
jgi:hypothetical protein